MFQLTALELNPFSLVESPAPVAFSSDLSPATVPSVRKLELPLLTACCHSPSQGPPAL